MLNSAIIGLLKWIDARLFSNWCIYSLHAESLIYNSLLSNWFSYLMNACWTLSYGLLQLFFYVDDWWIGWKRHLTITAIVRRHMVAPAGSHRPSGGTRCNYPPHSFSLDKIVRNDWLPGISRRYSPEIQNVCHNVCLRTTSNWTSKLSVKLARELTPACIVQSWNFYHSDWSNHYCCLVWRCVL